MELDWENLNIKLFLKGEFTLNGIDAPKSFSGRQSVARDEKEIDSLCIWMP